MQEAPRLRDGEARAPELAHLGALGSLGLSRRQALWQVALASRPAGEMFAGGEEVEPSPLPEMTRIEETVAKCRQEIEVVMRQAGEQAAYDAGEMVAVADLHDDKRFSRFRGPALAAGLVASLPSVAAAPRIEAVVLHRGHGMGYGGAITAALVTTTSNGALVFNADGSFVYTPSTNFVGTDSFTYRATNTIGTGNLATVTITPARATLTGTTSTTATRASPSVPDASASPLPLSPTPYP